MSLANLTAITIKPHGEILNYLARFGILGGRIISIRITSVTTSFPSFLVPPLCKTLHMKINLIHMKINL